MEFKFIEYVKMESGIGRIYLNRPEKRNAFRPQTVNELCDAFTRIRDDKKIGVVLLTGVGPSKDGIYSFCSGGDQKVRGDSGYLDEDGIPRADAGARLACDACGSCCASCILHCFLCLLRFAVLCRSCWAGSS